jgi:tRNA 2-thiouridine synthesizing protein A
LSDPSPEEVSAFRVDARGLPCPLPIALLAKALKAHRLVQLSADDPAARGDLEAFCKQTGNQLLSLQAEGPLLTALVLRPAQVS